MPAIDAIANSGLHQATEMLDLDQTRLTVMQLLAEAPTRDDVVSFITSVGGGGPA